jgi:hypothetical protein
MAFFNQISEVKLSDDVKLSSPDIGNASHIPNIVHHIPSRPGCAPFLPYERH